MPIVAKTYIDQDQSRNQEWNLCYDMTMHASEEMAEDTLDIVDVESSILNGRLVKSEKVDPRGTRHIVHGQDRIEKHK